MEQKNEQATHNLELTTEQLTTLKEILFVHLNDISPIICTYQSGEVSLPLEYFRQFPTPAYVKDFDSFTKYEKTFLSVLGSVMVGLEMGVE